MALGKSGFHLLVPNGLQSLNYPLVKAWSVTNNGRLQERAVINMMELSDSKHRVLFQMDNCLFG